MAIMEENSILVNAGVITEFVINRPNSLNALNADVLQNLILQINKAVSDSHVRVITITGAGDKAFVAGADIASMFDLGPRAAADYVELGQRCMRTVERCRVPVIAAVNGYCLGGGMELALSCDLIVAASKAKLGLPEVGLGIVPGFGGTQRLVQRCGVGLAKRLVLTGEMLPADEALRVGLVDQVADEGGLQEHVRKLAEGIASKAPLAVERGKSLVRQHSETLLLAGLQSETEAFLELFDTNDRREGMQAFMEKRAAKFTGK